MSAKLLEGVNITLHDSSGKCFITNYRSYSASVLILKESQSCERSATVCVRVRNISIVVLSEQPSQKGRSKK